MRDPQSCRPPPSAAASPVEADPFLPSEYTAALLRQVRLRAPLTGRVLDMGTGSGVLLAALAECGAQDLVGVDIEPSAVHRAGALVETLGLPRACVRQGDLWDAVRGQSFDLVVFNPPQLPVRAGAEPGMRLRTWSDGGVLGREVIDRFLDGLPTHLTPEGATLVTHSGFLGLDETQRRLTRRGLRGEVVHTVTVHLGEAKLRQLAQDWGEHAFGRAVHRVGPYVFCDVQVLEIRHAERGAR